MNKSDVKLVMLLVVFCIFCLVLYFLFFKSSDKKNALVYYDGNLVMTIDLSLDGSYVTNGANGLVYMSVLNGKIKVDSEDSIYHICSRQGYISESYESIVCLPNKVVINIDSNDYDVVVK